MSRSLSSPGSVSAQWAQSGQSSSSAPTRRCFPAASAAGQRDTATRTHHNYEIQAGFRIRIGSGFNHSSIKVMRIPNPALKTAVYWQFLGRRDFLITINIFSFFFMTSKKKKAGFRIINICTEMKPSKVGSLERQAWQRVWPQKRRRGILSPCRLYTSSHTRHSSTCPHILSLQSCGSGSELNPDSIVSVDPDPDREWQKWPTKVE